MQNAFHGTVVCGVGVRKDLEIYIVAKHRRQGAALTRIATASVVAASASVMAPGVAGAAEVVVPNTNFSTEIKGLENVDGIRDVPNIEQWVPEFREAKKTSKPAVKKAAAAKKAASNSRANYAAKTSVPAAKKSTASANTTGAKVVAAVRSKIGSPYGWGAAGPHAFDCSGLTSWAYAQAGKSIPRTSSAQAAAGKPVAISDLQPGDIVAYYGGASHVAIYVGNGKIIDSLNSGSTVAERPLNYMPIHSAVRF